MTAGLGLIVFSTTPVVAQTTAAAAVQAQRDLTSSVVELVKAALALPADLEIDAPLRLALEALAKEHVTRMQPVVRGWVEDASRAAGTPSAAWRVAARFSNELGLHAIDSAGQDYDVVMAAAYRRVAPCQAVAGRSFLARRALFIQQVPQAQRRIALDGERALLARWGTPRSGLPARPVPSLAEREDAIIAGVEAGSADPTPALPPIVASARLIDRKRDLDEGTECALHEWGFAQAVASGRDPADALRDFRYAMLSPNHLLVSPRLAADAKEPAPGDYPRLAAVYGVEGTVTVRYTRNAAGQASRPEIIQRLLTVPCVPGRPVVFETVLDQVTLAQAAAQTQSVAASATAGGGAATARQTFQWRLE